MPENYVYVPTWLLMLLVFLASGCVQYALIGAVKLVDRWLKEPEAARPRLMYGPNGQVESTKPVVITLDQHRKERQG